MARRRTAAEQIGVPELDEQEEQAQQAAQQQLEAEAAAHAAAEKPDEPEDDPLGWVPDKFKKDPAKLAEGYAKLEAELRRRGQADAQRDREIEELREQVASQQRDTSDWDERIQAAYEDDPLATIQWMAQQAAAAELQKAFGERAKASEPQEQVQNELLAKTVDDLMEKEFDDWAEVKPLIAERLAEDQSLLPESAFSSLASIKRHMSMIYKDVKYDDLVQQQAELRERGLQQRDVDRDRKMQAQTLSGASGRAPEPTEGEQELAKMRAAMAGSSYGLHRALEKRG